MDEKLIKLDSVKYKVIYFHSQGGHTEAVYNGDEEKPMSRKEYKRNKLVRFYEWEYIKDEAANSFVVIKKANGEEIGRSVKRKIR